MSNEYTLFKELNLVVNARGKVANDINPSYFYNFLLHKITNSFKMKVLQGEKSDSKSGSYERLSKFVWHRGHVKKSIMTIPYNSTKLSMKSSLEDNLEKVYNKETK